MRVRKDARGHGKRRCWFRRVPPVGRADQLSVLCGGGARRVGVRPFPVGRRRCRTTAATAGPVPELSGDARVVAGGVVAAQGLSGRTGLVGAGCASNWCRSSADRCGVVGAGVDVAGVAAPGGGAARGRADRFPAIRGDRRGRCADPHFGRVRVGGSGRGGDGGGQVVVDAIRADADIGWVVVGAGRGGGVRWSASVAGLAGRGDRWRCNTS